MQSFSLSRKQIKILTAFLIGLLAITLGFLLQKIQRPSQSQEFLDQRFFQAEIVNEPIQPIPLEIPLEPKKVNLGDQLFHDPILSVNHQISCATCHNLETGGVDNLKLSPGIDGHFGVTNTSTVFNSLFNFKVGWAGQKDDLLSHVSVPITYSTVMGETWSEIVEKLKKSPEYVRAFSQSYSNGVTEDNIKDAIVIFEKSLYTPNAPFDQFIRGNEEAITAEEKAGYEIFKSYGCISCHQGINVGGNLFQKFGIFNPNITAYNPDNIGDLGRFNVTQDEKDRYVFRVPSLRNVELTAPYFHNGSAATLEEAVDIMAKAQLGRSLSPEQIDLVVQFLKTLTGEYQGQSLRNYRRSPSDQE